MRRSQEFRDKLKRNPEIPRIDYCKRRAQQQKENA